MFELHSVNHEIIHNSKKKHKIEIPIRISNGLESNLNLEMSTMLSTHCRNLFTRNKNTFNFIFCFRVGNKHIRMIRICALTRILTRQLLTHHVATNYPSVSSHLARTTVRLYANEFSQEKMENTRELIAAQDSETFGTLSVNVQPAEDELFDEGDIKEEKFLKHPPRKSQKLSTKQYADMIKEHLKYQRIKEALDVLEERMLKVDRVKPENYIYNLLIDGCAKVGYSKKAFNLFTVMRQRGLKVTGATYTSLFNACANAPWTNDGLNKATRLREIMLEKGYEPNAVNYNAMIKAFGRCNDLKTAFLIVDEMTDKKLPIEVETFNFLLQACASDQEFGFRHALLVWHKMYQRKLRPDIYSFNLMLRCCRDTNFGDVESMEQVLQTILLAKPGGSKEQIKLDAHSASDGQSVDSSLTEAGTNAAPNLLALKPHLGNLISLSEVTKPEDKLLLLGGFSGFLETMKHFDVRPDLKTYTELVEVIPPTNVAEKRLIAQLKKHEIKCDVDFFNILMKKRSMRYDYEGAREVLDMIEKVKLDPDIVTYGVLSLGCQSEQEARALIQEMDEKGIKMNIKILGAMLKAGCVKKNFNYIMEVLHIIKDLKLKPSDRIIEMLAIFVKSCNRFKKRDWKIATKEFRHDFNIFKQKLSSWQNSMGLADLEFEEAKKLLKDAPWEQFQTVQAEGFEDTKGLKQQRLKKTKRYLGKIKETDMKAE